MRSRECVSQGCASRSRQQEGTLSIGVSGAGTQSSRTAGGRPPPPTVDLGVALAGFSGLLGSQPCRESQNQPDTRARAMSSGPSDWSPPPSYWSSKPRAAPSFHLLHYYVYASGMNAKRRLNAGDDHAHITAESRVRRAVIASNKHSASVISAAVRSDASLSLAHSDLPASK